LVGSIFHMTRKIVSEMTYNVSMGTLNPTIPYHSVDFWKDHDTGLGICTWSGTDVSVTVCMVVDSLCWWVSTTRLQLLLLSGRVPQRRPYKLWNTKRCWTLFLQLSVSHRCETGIDSMCLFTLQLSYSNYVDRDQRVTTKPNSHGHLQQWDVIQARCQTNCITYLHLTNLSLIFAIGLRDFC